MSSAGPDYAWVEAEQLDVAEGDPSEIKTDPSLPDNSAQVGVFIAPPSVDLASVVFL
jgi:hypothetical protein